MAERSSGATLGSGFDTVAGCEIGLGAGVLASEGVAVLDTDATREEGVVRDGVRDGVAACEGGRGKTGIVGLSSISSSSNMSNSSFRP